jgi:hypothetical protein
MQSGPVVDGVYFQKVSGAKWWSVTSRIVQQMEVTWVCRGVDMKHGEDSSHRDAIFPQFSQGNARLLAHAGRRRFTSPESLEIITGMTGNWVFASLSAGVRGGRVIKMESYAKSNRNPITKKAPPIRSTR